MVDLTVRTKRPTSYDELCVATKEAAAGSLQSILGYTEDQVVSSDFISCDLSSIFDANADIELNCQFFKVIGWYDNEWGYSQRVIDLLKYMATVDGLVDADSIGKSVAAGV